MSRTLRVPILLFALLWFTAACTSLTPRERATTPPTTVVLVSIDGLPADMLGTGAMPTLDALAIEGARAEWMNPSFPTLTFPNHYTLVTGLRPDHHGIVHNAMRDERLGRYVSKEQASATDGRWWGGEPIWATLQKQGGIAATMFWPGSEARIAGELPRYRRSFDASVTPEARVDQLLAWLDLPETERPRLLTVYFEHYDVTAHDAGTRSTLAMEALRRLDSAIARLREGLHARGMLDRTDLIVISDHGMADVPREQRIWLEDVLDPTLYDTEWWGTLLGLHPNPGQTDAVERVFLGRHPHFECWRRDGLPTHWRFGRHPRMPPIVCQVQTGWRVQSKQHRVYEQAVKGEHGFAVDDPSMRAVFVANGPSFKPGTALPAFDNVDLYPLLARLLRVRPAENDGSLSSTEAALR
jgi:predicted AlkP superfamily pyrophosphatase or phosphodiesterase